MNKNNRKLFIHRLGIAMLLGILLLVTACGQSTPQKRASQEPTKPSQSKTEPSQGKTSTDAISDKWAKTVELAKKEGKLVLSGPPSESWRTVLTAFQKEYPEIKIEYSAGNSRDFWPKLKQEQKVGQYLWDLRVGGPDPQVYSAIKDGELAEIRPLLQPEVADDKKWMEGVDGLFADNQKKYIVGFSAYTRANAFVNRDIIPKGEITSTKDLIDPKYKGKIVLQDPRGGSGLGATTMLLAGFGEDYVRKLLTEQDVVVTGDNRQEAEWLVRGKYPIAIGTVGDFLMDFEKQGLKFKVEPILGGPQALSTGFGGLQMPKNMPHPNATAVYINWLLSAKAQEMVAKDTDATSSRRLDVKPGDPNSVIDVKHIDDYIYHQSEQMLETRTKAQKLSDELIKK